MEKVSYGFAIAEQTSDFVGMAGVDGLCFYVNPAGRRLVGLAPDADVTALE